MSKRARGHMVTVEEFFSMRGKPADWHWVGQMFEDMVEAYVATLPEGRLWRVK